MLLPDNIHPEKSVYFNGAIVLQILQKNDRLEMLNLYGQAVKKCPMSFSVFILCLDWLYLINAAELKNDKVILCS